MSTHIKSEPGKGFSDTLRTYVAMYVPYRSQSSLFDAIDAGKTEFVLGAIKNAILSDKGISQDAIILAFAALGIDSDEISDKKPSMRRRAGW